LIKAAAVIKSSSAYWGEEKVALQRVYGISFPDKQMLKVRTFYDIA